MGVKSIGVSHNHVAHPFDVFEYFIIPKTQNSKAAAAQLRIAHRIGYRLRMLSSVDFDDDARGKANEVDNIRADRALASKPHSPNLFSLQFPPESKLGIRHSAAKLSGEIALLSFAHG